MTANTKDTGDMQADKATILAQQQGVEGRGHLRGQRACEPTPLLKDLKGKGVLDSQTSMCGETCFLVRTLGDNADKGRHAIFLK